MISDMRDVGVVGGEEGEGVWGGGGGVVLMRMFVTHSCRVCD